MEGFALIAFKSVMLILYLYLSIALLFQHLVRRWVIFTIAFFALYLVAIAAFFGHLPGINSGVPGWRVTVPIRVIELLGIAAVVGWGLSRKEPWGFDQILGGVILFMAVLTAFVVVSHALAGGQAVASPSWLFPGSNG